MYYLAFRKRKLEKGEKVNIKIIENEEKKYYEERGYKIIELEKAKNINIEILSSWLHTEIIEF